MTPTIPDFFLSFGQQVASIQNRSRLLQIIQHELRSFLGFSHSTIFLLDKEGAYINNFLVDLESNSSGASTPFLQSVKLGKMPVDDQFLNPDLPSYPMIFDFDELSETRDILPYLKTDRDYDIRKGILLNLRQGNVIIGNWILLCEDQRCIQKEQLPLLQALAHHITGAVSNITAQEIIAEREKESEILQGLNIDFASIREKKELLSVIHHKLRNLFDFGHHWVAVINEDELTLSSFLRDTRSRSKEHSKYEMVIRAKYPINDRIFNKVLLSKDPLTFDLELLLAKGGLPEYLQINYDSGIKKVVMVGLQVRSRIIGIWAICQVENQHLSAKQTNLIKNISNQLSIAVENIRINEAILAKEAEREQLLQLSSDITTIRGKNDLFNLINRNIKELFPFKDMGIMILNDDNTYQPFLFSSGNRVVSNVSYDRDPWFNRVMATGGVVVFDMEQLKKEEKVPDYIRAEYETGIREKVAIQLRDDSKPIGLFYVNTTSRDAYSDHELELIKGVSYQLSTAVSNILANEEIIQREQERDLLIALSIDIAAVRNSEELLRLITQRVKHILGCSHIALCTLNEDQTTLSAFLIDPESRSKDHPDYRSGSRGRFPLNDGFLDKVCANPGPIVFDLENRMESSTLPIYLKMNRESGIRQVVMTRFSKGAEVLGCWMIFYDRKIRMDLGRLNLIEGLANQISITVSNIIANEKVKDQLSEVSLHRQQLEEEKIYLKEEIEATHNYTEIIGNSPAIQTTFRQITQVAYSDSTVLILGETGTGKELVARAIHNNSPRKNKLMIKVNCAALPVNLIESELFGHERGSFTGAMERRVGKFELANGGTLFLDEIGEMPLELQVKLLRVLQEREIERIGGKTTIKVDVRIIAATNRDLEKETGEGRFRNDLYYRLNIFPIHLPPLRDRNQDIPLLASWFIQRYAKKAGRTINTLSNRVLQDLTQYNWPGNIRELEHLIERSVLQTSGESITQIHLPSPKAASSSKAAAEALVLKTIDENERDHILNMLKYCKGRVAGEGGAAEILGVPPSTLNSKIKRLGIRREHLKS